MNQIQVPLGMRDHTFEEVRKKRQLQKRVEDVFESYGYQEIMTPSIEFLQTYQQAFSSVNEADMYKFFDQDGNVLTLRMDMTVPIARLCASKNKEAEAPYRFRYCSSVYKVRQMFAGKRGQVSDCGVELIGLDEASDPEVLACALDTMNSFKVDNYILEIGNSRFFKEACKQLSISKEEGLRLASLVDNKSMVELKAYIDSLSLENRARDFFMQLPLLNGDEDVLAKARTICFCPSLVQEIDHLEHLYLILKDLGYEDHISFDLGKVPHLDYYTGIIFEGFVEGVGSSVLSGGRYDDLLQKFGVDMPACGFSVKLDYLLDVVPMDAQSITKIYYPLSKQMDAFRMAQELRTKTRVQLIPSQVEEIQVTEEREEKA